MASQLIQYGRWNDIKVYPLLMTFSNKEEPKVHVMLEVRLSVIGWIIWVLSSSFYWKIKNELTISCLLSWENSWSSECRQSELLPRWLWRLTGWPNNNSWELCSPAAPDSRGPHTSHLTPHRVPRYLTGLLQPGLAVTFLLVNNKTQSQINCRIWLRYLSMISIYILRPPCNYF